MNSKEKQSEQVENTLAVKALTTFSDNGISIVKEIIEKGIDYLYSAQNGDGSFPEYIYLLKGNNWRTDTPTLFSTSLICSSVFESLKKSDMLQTEAKSKLEIIRKRSLDLFISEMNGYGVWKFAKKGTRWQGLPFDLDDTCCISFLLKDYHPYIHFGINKKIISKNQNEDGLFYTWLLPKNLEEKNDIDSIVNVNTVLYLGENTQTERAINYICNLINEGKEEGTYYYYRNNYCLYYFVSKAYANGVNSFSKCRNSIVEKCLDYKLNSADPLFNVINLITLYNLGIYDEQREQRIIDMLVNTINPIQLNTQAGFWEKVPFYQGAEYPKPIDILWGSECLTTAFVIEGLTKFYSQQKVNSR